MKFVEWILMGACLYIGWTFVDWCHYKWHKSNCRKSIITKARQMQGLDPIKSKGYKRVVGFSMKD